MILTFVKYLFPSLMRFFSFFFIRYTAEVKFFKNRGKKHELLDEHNH